MQDSLVISCHPSSIFLDPSGTLSEWNVIKNSSCSFGILQLSVLFERDGVTRIELKLGVWLVTCRNESSMSWRPSVCLQRYKHFSQAASFWGRLDELFHACQQELQHIYCFSSLEYVESACLGRLYCQFAGLENCDSRVCLVVRAVSAAFTEDVFSDLKETWMAPLSGSQSWTRLDSFSSFLLIEFNAIYLLVYDSNLYPIKNEFWLVGLVAFGSFFCLCGPSNPGRSSRC